MFNRAKIALAVLSMAGASIIATAQPLASGQWAKFSVSADGVYKIDYNLLKKSGFNPDKLNPVNIQLFSNGSGMLPQPNASPRQNQLKEMAIFIQGGDDGHFDQGDYILFFGLGPDEYQYMSSSGAFHYERNLYSDKNYYFLTLGGSPGKRLAIENNQVGNFPIISEYPDFAYYETEQYNLLKSGRDWYGEQFNASTDITIQFGIPGIVSGSPIIFASHVMAQSYNGTSSFNVFFNNVQIAEQKIAIIPETQYGIKGLEKIDTVNIDPTQVNATSGTQQNIKYQFIKAPTGFSIGYLDYFVFSMTRKIAWYNGATIFTTPASSTNAVSTFAVADLPASGNIWDVSDPFTSKAQTIISSSGQAFFTTDSDVLKKFVAFTPTDAKAPAYESQVPNQNLSVIKTPDLLIITHPDFKSEAQRLADFRQKQNNITVQIITPQEIYNEYSGGKQDITALRDFVRDLAGRGGSGLDNLLLFGRCSYDYKNRVAANTNFVPTYESRNSLDPLSTYSSDDYFAFLDSSEGEWPEDPPTNYSMDIGVGRISVTTIQQAKDVVDKLIDYESNSKRFGPWRQTLAFVADDGDSNIHQDQADKLATSINASNPDFFTKKIYLDQYKQVTRASGQYSPDARDALDRSVDDGALIVNFTGHGSETQWMQEQILDEALVESWKNAPEYPLFVTATCEFGRHDDPFQISSAERLQLQPKGGAIGLVTTARPVNSSTNFELNKAFYKALFTKVGNDYYDLGTVFRQTKNNSVSGVNNRNFSLLGDPSMYIALPQNDVILNSVKTSSGSDTLKALSTAVITGNIRRNGNVATDYNGNVSLTLLDQPLAFTTLGDENPPFTYSQWSNAVFRGSASVTAGSFQFSFVLPQNIESIAATGKIVLYSNNVLEDASGFFNGKIGGVEPSPSADNTLPDMLLFVGDTTFVDGGIASPNTDLIVKLHDASGISISDFGDANSIIAVLDDSLQYNLNSSYRSNKDDYTNGVARFSLKDLKPGRHHVLVSASDTYSNRISGNLNFVITEGNLVISEFYNYPNPFSAMTGKTTLGFSHNRPGDDLEVDLTIFDLAGQMVDVEHFSVSFSLTTVTLSEWNGTMVNGNKLGSGVYLGKVSVRSVQDGSKNQKFTKLIIVN